MRRLDVTERNHTDLAASVTRVVEAGADSNVRIASLEQRHIDNRIDDARREEREKAFQKEIEGVHAAIGNVQKSVDAIRSGYNKLLWIIATPLVGAIIVFIISGGLKIG